MTKLFMFLFADDYGLFGTCPILNGVFVLFATIVIVVFTIKLWNSEAEYKKVIAWTSFYSVFLVSLYYAFFTITPAKISEYGTNTQKSNLVRCVNEYTKYKHVSLDAVTYENIINIMRECKELDEIRLVVQEQELKDKQLQDGIKKTSVNTNKSNFD